MPHRRSWLRASAPDASLALDPAAGGGAPVVPTYRRMVPAISMELRRCRRYERPMAVLVMGLDTGGDAGAASAAASRPELDLVTFVVIGSLLRDATRESDIVTYAAQEHVYALFLPEADDQGAVRAARRLATECRARAAVRIRTGIAVFPGHGLTVDTLFGRAMDVLAGAPPVAVASTTPAAAAWQSARSAR